MSALQGRCLCGAITLEAGDPQMFLECHCTRCRNWTGCASSAVIVAPAESVEVTAGESLLKRYEEEGFSPRSFCTECGTSLYSGGGDTLYIYAGVLDDVPMEVAGHIQVADKAPYHEIGGNAPQYDTFPG